MQSFFKNTQRYVAVFLTAKERGKYFRREMNANKERLPFVRKEVIHFLTGSLIGWSDKNSLLFFILFLTISLHFFCEVYFDWYWLHCSNNHQKKIKIQ